MDREGGARGQSAGDLVAPRLVRRGDTIALVSRQGGIEVCMAGRALADAGARERVSVENLSSRRVVQGTVDEAGDADSADILTAASQQADKDLWFIEAHRG